MPRRYLSTAYEQKLWGQGYEGIAGIDEAGRGALAGPIVAAAVILAPGTRLHGIHDSKLLSPKARAQRFVEITSQALAWSVGAVSQETIDAKGISFANKEAFRLAVQGLRVVPDYIVTDALPIQYQSVATQAVIDGDAKIVSVAAASIIAKVYRDQLMTSADGTWPVYGFARHKGYGTLQHRLALRQHGACHLHRQSFLRFLTAEA